MACHILHDGWFNAQGKLVMLWRCPDQHGPLSHLVLQWWFSHSQSLKTRLFPPIVIPQATPWQPWHIEAQPDVRLRRLRLLTPPELGQALAEALPAEVPQGAAASGAPAVDQGAWDGKPENAGDI